MAAKIVAKIDGERMGKDGNEGKTTPKESFLFLVTCPRDKSPWREIVSFFLKLGDLTICEFP